MEIGIQYEFYLTVLDTPKSQALFLNAATGGKIPFLIPLIQKHQGRVIALFGLINFLTCVCIHGVEIGDVSVNQFSTTLLPVYGDFS